MIELRFGIRDGSEHTLEEIGDFLGGLTRERIRQIEGRALQILRRFAVELDDETVMETLDEMRQAAHKTSKSNRNANRLAPPELIPTTTELAELREQVNNGMSRLQSLGIRITA